MVIYLRHLIHGTKVAISEDEAVSDEREGWERFDPSTLDEDHVAAFANTLGVKRRGRPPKQPTVQ